MIRRISIQTQEISMRRQTNVNKLQFPSDPPPAYTDINRRGHLSLEQANRVYLNFDPPPPYEPNNIQCTPVGLPSYEDATRDSRSTQTENTNSPRDAETITTNNTSNPQISTIFNNTRQSNPQTNNRRIRNPFSGCCGNCFGRIFNRNRSRNRNETSDQIPIPSYENVLEQSIRQQRIAILELDTRISNRIDHCRSNGINTRTDPQLAQLRDQRQDMSYNLQDLLYRL